MDDDVQRSKRSAAEAAAALVEDGMRLGLGTGSTVAFLLPALAARGLRDVRCVATSTETERHAAELGLPIEPFETLSALDLTIDGADQVAPDGWLVKGGGGAHVREKIVAAAARRFVVIVSPEKLVERIHAPVPVELLRFGAPATLARLGRAEPRAGWPPSPDGGLIADYHGAVGDPARLAEWLATVPGVVGHGLFEPALVADVLVGRPDGTHERFR